MNGISSYLDTINADNCLKFKLLLKHNPKGLIINITEKNTFFFIIRKRSDEKYIFTKSVCKYPIGYRYINEFKKQRNWSDRENNQYFAEYFTKEYLVCLEKINFHWKNINFVYIISTIPCDFLGKYIEYEKGVKFLKHINLNKKQAKALICLDSSDYQNRNGAYAKPNIPDSIQVTANNGFIKVCSSFKNTNEEMAKIWMCKKLKNFSIPEDSYKIYLSQTGDYNDDWVEVTAKIVI